MSLGLIGLHEKGRDRKRTRYFYRIQCHTIPIDGLKMDWHVLFDGKIASVAIILKPSKENTGQR